MERKFKKEIHQLDKVFDFIREFIDRYKINQAAFYFINLALEELFTNMVKYNPNGKKNISISLTREENKVHIRLDDISEVPFDITKTREVNTHLPLSDRPIGGLGVHLVKKMSDEIHYEYTHGHNIITLTIYLEK
jgi:anti-sigma regulatory factor (Ser/Thr protein kinase)